MPAKQTADLSPSLVVVKGRAGVALDATERKPEVRSASSPANEPLNFKVDPDFRRRFRLRAAEANLKLNALLREALEAWEEKRGIR